MTRTGLLQYIFDRIYIVIMATLIVFLKDDGNCGAALYDEHAIQELQVHV